MIALVDEYAVQQLKDPKRKQLKWVTKEGLDIDDANFRIKAGMEQITCYSTLASWSLRLPS